MFLTCWFTTLVQRGGVVRCLIIRPMHSHKCALRVGGSKPQNLIFTGCSHKAIGKRAGPLNSNNNSTRSFSSKLLKLSFCDPYPAAPHQELSGIDRGEEERKYFALWRVEIVNGNSCARTGTATTEENHFGSSCCFMAEY